MRVLILTEGGKANGFGHITRCLALRDAFEVKGYDVSIVVNGDTLVRRQFRGQLNLVFDWLKEKSRAMTLVRNADAVIIDSYLAPLDFYRRISKVVPIPVYLDDNVRPSYPQGIVVNGAVNAEKLNYPGKKNVRYLLGAKYILLRKNFWRASKRNVHKNIRNVFVTFGGMDRAFFINKMLAYLQPRFPQWHFHIVAAQPCRPIARYSQRTKYYSGITPQKMKSLMAHCDIAISGGGQTTNELAAAGLPTVGICFAKNQKLHIRGWQRQGFLKYAGFSDDPAILKNLEDSLCQLTFNNRRNMGKAGQMLADGAGALRVAREIIDSSFSFQKVGMRDRKQVLKWSNSPDVRSVSFSTRPIKWVEHCRWFKKKLEDPRCYFYKIVWLGRAIGQVRFDRRGKKARISVSLDKKFRGKGLGGPAIRIASQHVFSVEPSIRMIEAFVKAANMLSAKAFLKAGFRLVGKKKIAGQKTYHFSKGNHENTIF